MISEVSSVHIETSSSGCINLYDVNNLAFIEPDSTLPH
jgi:hypothetical protein